MEEFTNSLSQKIVYIILAIFMFGFSSLLFFASNLRANQEIIAVPIVLLIIAVLVIITQIKRKIIISTDSIIKINAFGKKELLTTNVKGYRLSTKNISIEPVSSQYSKIFISQYTGLQDSHDLVKWIKENFTDLDSVDLANERNRVLQDSRLGATEEERKKQIEKEKQIAIAYNVWGFLAAAIGVFSNNKAIAILLLLYPLSGILVIAFSKGLIKFISDIRTSVYQFIILGFIIPSFAMLAKSVSKYEIQQYQNLWLPFISIGIVLFLLLYFYGFNKAMPSAVSQIIIMVVAAFIYGYGSTLQINCVLDESTPLPVHTTISDKYKQYSKGQHYYLYLNAWQPNMDQQKIEVSQITYQKYLIGDAINLQTRKGALNIPWYYLDK